MPYPGLPAEGRRLLQFLQSSHLRNRGARQFGMQEIGQVQGSCNRRNDLAGTVLRVVLMMLLPCPPRVSRFVTRFNFIVNFAYPSNSLARTVDNYR